MAAGMKIEKLRDAVPLNKRISIPNILTND